MKLGNKHIGRFFSDPGDGWLQVPYTWLEQLGIQQQISPDSHRTGNTVYLQKDSDMEIFLQAVKLQRMNFDIVDFPFDQSEEDSFIRALPAYCC